MAMQYQEQNCAMTLAQGVEEYRKYLKINDRKMLFDKPGSKLILEHDVTHVIFGLDTTIEEEAILDSWVLWGCKWKFSYLKQYQKLPEIKDLQKMLFKEFGVFGMIKIFFKMLPLKIKAIKRARAMSKKWSFVLDDTLLSKKINVLRKEYNIRILDKKERTPKSYIQWSGSFKAKETSST